MEPIFSNLIFADLENEFASKVILSEISPDPNILSFDEFLFIICDFFKVSKLIIFLLSILSFLIKN